jgi:hypothetical protein
VKTLKVISGIILLALLAAQFIRPDRSDPGLDPTLAIVNQMNVPPSVRSILERSCFDCHSNQTRWPWYSSFAPISWLVADDVKQGRNHLNLSEWGTYTRKRQIAKLDMMVSEVDKGQMPLKTYLLLHRDGTLSEADKDVFCTWAEQASDSLRATGK